MKCYHVFGESLLYACSHPFYFSVYVQDAEVTSSVSRKARTTTDLYVNGLFNLNVVLRMFHNSN